jgi:hypothetical protein
MKHVVYGALALATRATGAAAQGIDTHNFVIRSPACER